MKSTIKTAGVTVWRAIAAGICIGLGGTVFLAVENTVIGSVLFAFGLFIICTYKLNLYTGRIGYVSVSHFWPDMGNMLLIWIGNLIGTAFMGYAMRLAGKQAMIDRAVTMVQNKVSAGFIKVFITAIFCGMLMYIAVNTFRLFGETRPLIGCMAILFCVVLFILSGFEHCIANMYYISIANAWSGDTLLMTLAATLGNSAGATVIRHLVKPA